jgi:hypothetical protein
MQQIMYEVIKPGTHGFDADVLKFTDDKAEAGKAAKQNSAELWQVTYEGDSWKRWKEERIEP